MKKSSFCFGSHHQCTTKSIEVDLTKTGLELFFANFIQSFAKHSLLVNDTTVQAVGPGIFFKIIRRRRAKAGENLDTNVLKNPGKALETGAKIGNAAVSKNPNATLSAIPGIYCFIIQ